MSGTGLYGVVLAGLLAGWAAQRLVGRRMSLFATMLLGLAGAGLGGAIAQALGLRFQGLLATLALSTLGATMILAIAALVIRRR